MFWDEFANGPDEDAVLFDVDESNIEWSGWLAGVDYTSATREARRGEGVVWRILDGVQRRGARVRTQALCTHKGEPVTRVEMHPDGWRDLEQRAADGDRYRRMMAMLHARQLILDGEDAETWWHKYCPHRTTTPNAANA